MRELSMNELDEVTGGSPEQNPDGTYNIYDGQLIRRPDMWYAYVYGNYPNATLSTMIEYCYYVVDLNGNLIDEGLSKSKLSDLLPYIT